MRWMTCFRPQHFSMYTYIFNKDGVVLYVDFKYQTLAISTSKLIKIPPPSFLLLLADLTPGPSGNRAGRFKLAPTFFSTRPMTGPYKK